MLLRSFYYQAGSRSRSIETSTHGRSTPSTVWVPELEASMAPIATAILNYMPTAWQNLAGVKSD